MDVLNAIVDENADLLTQTLADGGDPNATDAEGVPACLHAADTGRTDLVKALIDAGANLEATDTIGWTALMAAIASGSEELVALLLTHGANANHVAREDTPLTTAAEASIAIQRLLLEHGADPNLRRPDGWTPLMLAAFGGEIPRLQLLLEHGADATVTMGPRLMDAATVAAAHHHHEARELLLDAARSSGPELKELWARVQKWCESKAPDLAAHFENTAGNVAVPPDWAALPADAREQLTGWASGLPFYDYAGLGIERAVAVSEEMAQRAAQGEFVGRSTALGEDEPIQRVYWSEAWVPLARDAEGNMLLIDLAPEDSGIEGQLISWSLEQGPLAVLASGLTPFLRHMIVRIRRGGVRYDRRTASLTLAK